MWRSETKNYNKFVQQLTTTESQRFSDWLYNILHALHRRHIVPLLLCKCCICVCWGCHEIVIQPFPTNGQCFQNQYLATVGVQLLNMQSLPMNGSTGHNIPLYVLSSQVCIVSGSHFLAQENSNSNSNKWNTNWTYCITKQKGTSTYLHPWQVVVSEDADP